MQKGLQTCAFPDDTQRWSVRTAAIRQRSSQPVACPEAQLLQQDGPLCPGATGQLGLADQQRAAGGCHHRAKFGLAGQHRARGGSVRIVGPFLPVPAECGGIGAELVGQPPDKRFGREQLQSLLPHR